MSAFPSFSFPSSICRKGQVWSEWRCYLPKPLGVLISTPRRFDLGSRSRPWLPVCPLPETSLGPILFWNSLPRMCSFCWLAETGSNASWQNSILVARWTHLLLFSKTRRGFTQCSLIFYLVAHWTHHQYVRLYHAVVQMNKHSNAWCILRVSN